MKYSILIDNVTSMKWGLDIKLAYLFSWIYSLPSWAEKVIIDGDVFYFASRKKAINELPLLTDKPDTMYRYYKKLEHLGLIIIKKVDNKDYISITTKGKKWNSYLSDASEKHPSILENPSESSSEKNPTYNIINIDKIIRDNEKESIKENLSEDVEKIYKLYPSKCLVGKRSLGKCSKDKDKILRLLKKEYSFEKLEGIVMRYISECKNTNTYMKNFSTFLNNIPDYDSEPLLHEPTEQLYTYVVEGQGQRNKVSEEQYKKDLKRCEISGAKLYNVMIHNV